MTQKQAQKLPRILADQILSLEIWGKMKSESNLLYEAKWLQECLNSSDLAEEYSSQQIAGLNRYVNRLEAKGVRPEPWDE